MNIFKMYRLMKEGAERERLKQIEDEKESEKQRKDTIILRAVEAIVSEPLVGSWEHPLYLGCDAIQYMDYVKCIRSFIEQYPKYLKNIEIKEKETQRKIDAMKRDIEATKEKARKGR